MEGDDARRDDAARLRKLDILPCATPIYAANEHLAMLWLLAPDCRLSAADCGEEDARPADGRCAVLKILPRAILLTIVSHLLLVTPWSRSTAADRSRDTAE